MGPLKNPRHERYCQELFKGEPQNAAYETAGYQYHEGNASRLRSNEKVISRLSELQAEAQRSNEVTVASLLQELETARTKATDLNQLSAAVRATSEKAKISGLLIERVEIGKPNEFEDLNSPEAIVERLKSLIGNEAAEVLCSYFGINGNGAEGVKSVSSLPFQRKSTRLKRRLADEAVIRNALAPLDAEITDDDLAQLRELVREYNGRFNDLVDGIKARSARLVNAVDPAQIERKRLFGNGKQRY
jgi:hypothetical protein